MEVDDCGKGDGGPQELSRVCTCIVLVSPFASAFKFEEAGHGLVLKRLSEHSAVESKVSSLNKVISSGD